MLQRSYDAGFWAGRRVLVTGHTGFKGAWLTCWLLSLGARVHAVSLPGEHGDRSLWEALALRDADGLSEDRRDITGTEWLEGATSFAPEVVLHLAAQSLVSEGYRDPVTTWTTNVVGTARVLELVSSVDSLQAAVMVTTDKVYDVRQPTPYREDHFLGGKDPYSASKAGAELVVSSWPARSPRVATARAGNVIGGGDHSKDRIVPDLVRAWSSAEGLTLRSPTAVRPWQHVVEPLLGYLLYAEDLAVREPGDPDLPLALNFGPPASEAVPVQALVDHAAGTWQRLTGSVPPPSRVVPQPGLVETQDLTLDASLAAESLRWDRVWGWREAIDRTLEWYVRVEAGEDARALTLEQLRAYAG